MIRNAIEHKSNTRYFFTHLFAPFSAAVVAFVLVVDILYAFRRYARGNGTPSFSCLVWYQNYVFLFTLSTLRLLHWHKVICYILQLVDWLILCIRQLFNNQHKREITRSLNSANVVRYYGNKNSSDVQNLKLIVEHQNLFRDSRPLKWSISIPLNRTDHFPARLK